MNMGKTKLGETTTRGSTKSEHNQWALDWIELNFIVHCLKKKYDNEEVRMVPLP